MKMRWFWMVSLISLIVMVFVMSLSAETIWWNADRTKQEAPRTKILEAGPPVYVELGSGQLSSPIGGGYLGPGNWRVLMRNNPLVGVTANSSSPVPEYAVFDEKVSFEGFEGCPVQYYIRRYMTIVDEIGGWVDHGDGPPMPLYKTVYRWVLYKQSTSALFYGEFRLVYWSSADVNRDGNINILDYVIASRYLGQKVPGKHPADVDGNGFITREDTDLIGRLLGATPPPPDEKPMSLLAPKKQKTTAAVWSKLKLKR